MHIIQLEIFCFEHLGRYFPLHKLFYSPTDMIIEADQLRGYPVLL